MYKAVLLDVYGTLLHDDDPWAAEAASLVADLAGVDADAAFLNRDGRRLPDQLTAIYTVDTLTALLPLLRA